MGGGRQKLLHVSAPWQQAAARGGRNAVRGKAGDAAAAVNHEIWDVARGAAPQPSIQRSTAVRPSEAARCAGVRPS